MTLLLFFQFEIFAKNSQILRFQCTSNLLLSCGKWFMRGLFEYLVPSLNHFETLKKFFKEGLAGAINDF